MKKVIIVIGMLFCVLGNAQRWSDVPKGERTDSIALLSPQGNRLKLKHISISDLAGWINDAITGGASDNQQITKVNDLLSLENGGNVDLSEYADQQITDFSLSGNLLSLSLEGNSTINVDLSSLAGGGSGGADTAAQIVAKLETLTGGDRLDYSAIKNTPTFTDTNTTNSSITVTGSATKTITITDSNSGTVTTTFTDLQGSGGGSGNGNIIVANSLSDITNAGSNAYIDIQSNITAIADFTPPANQTWQFTTGSIDMGVFTLDWNGATIITNGTSLAVNLFNGTSTGNVLLGKSYVYATNFGAIDDNSIGTDNFNVGKQLLHLVNQNSSELRWNKINTGIYYRRATDYDLGSPFFPNLPTRDDMWVVGDGYDNVTITHEGSTRIKTIPNNTSDSGVYLTYNTANSVIQGGVLEGDRYDHLYDQGLQVLTPASTAGNVRLRILEFNPKLDNDLVNEINEVFSLSNGGVQANIDEIVSFVNTDPAFADYTVTDSGNGLDMRISGQPGVFYNLFLTDESTGGSFNDPVSPYEWGHGIVIGSNTINISVRDIKIVKFHGDGTARQTQGNGTSYTTFSDLTQGNIDEFGVTDTDPNYYYQTVERPFDTRHEWFRLQGRSGQSIDLAFWRYWIAYYDLDGNFIEKSPELTPYQYYYKPTENYAQYKIIVDNNGSDITGFDYNIATESYAFGGEFKNITYDQNRRHCITNPPLGIVMENIKFYNTGGVLPEGAVNIEDYGKKAIGYTFSNCEFQNNVGFDIILQGPSQVNITGCRFLSNSYNVQGQYNAIPSSISTGFGRQVNINNSFFDNKAIGLDLYASFVNNKVNKGSLNVRSANVFVSNNTFVNTKIDGEDFSNGSGGLDVSYFKDNLLLYSEPWGNYPLLDDENTMVWEGNTLKFNDRTTQHLTITDDSIRDLKIQNTGDTYLRAQSTTANSPEHSGRIKGMRIEGLEVIPSGFHTLGFPYYASDIVDLNVSSSLIIDHGYFKNFKITDSNIEGWLNLILDEFPDDGVGEFKTITIKDTDFLLPANIDGNEGYLNNSQYGGTQVTKFIKSFLNKNVNLVFENVKFISEDTTNDRFMYLGHRGTTKFLNCTFSAPNAEVIDLTSSGTSAITGGVYTGPNTGDVTIINPTYNNISFNLRAGDTQVFYGGSATDVDAIHDNVAGEINAITSKATPVSGDLILIEDSEDGFSKKKADLSTLLGGGGGGGTVTSIDASVSGGLTVSGNPITTTGTLAFGIDAAALRTTLNIEDGATADQTNTEIVNAIDTELGQTDWKTGGAIDYSQNAVYQSSSSLSPTMSLINSSNTRYRTYAQGNIAYVESTDPTTNTPKELRFNTSAIKFVNPTDLGSNSSPARDIYASRNIFASEFRKEGGTNDQFLKAGGGVDSNTYIRVPTPTLVNISRTFALGDFFNTIYSSSTNPTYTVPDNATVAFPLGTRIFITNTSAVNTITIAAAVGVTINEDVGGLTIANQGGYRTLEKLETNLWVLK